MLHEWKRKQVLPIIHDGVTLDNHKKYQAFALQFVDLTWICNHVVVISFKSAPTSWTFEMVELTEKEVRDAIGYEYKDIITSMVQDVAATYIARALDYDNEDKVGRNAIGEIVRRDGRSNAINPFIVGMNVVDLFRKKAQHPTY